MAATGRLVAVLLLFAAFMKLIEVREFADLLREWSNVPEYVAVLLSGLIPFVEVVLGT